MKDISKVLKTCKWCYRIFPIEDISKHSVCMNKRNQVVQRRKRSLNYDKTGGQKMTEQLKTSNQRRFWIDEFDEEDWQALFMTDLEELFEYDKAYLRVF